jgi:methyl-accepting chemotaxis protein
MSIIISDTEPRVQYTATAGQTSFTVGFEFFDNADLKVFNGTTLLTYAASPSDATEYSVSGAGQTGGGSITLGSPGATVNDIITISRDVAIERVTDFPTSGAFQIGSLNTELDKIIAMCQQLERDLKFSPRAAATTANTFDITFPNLAANKVLSVNSAGTGLEFAQDITDITTIAGIASDVSAVSAIAADVTAVANDATDIGVVSTNIASVNTVATNIADVIKVADDLNEAVSEVETVANDLNEAVSEIDTVANNITDVNTVGK